MKSLHVLLEEIKDKHPELFAKIEIQIHEHAKKAGIQLDEPKDTEHPVKPPNHP